MYGASGPKRLSILDVTALAWAGRAEGAFTARQKELTSSPTAIRLCGGAVNILFRFHSIVQRTLQDHDCI